MFNIRGFVTSKARSIVRHRLSPSSPVRLLPLSKTPYQITLSREEGEKELASLVDTARTENVWAYAHDTSVWTNFGVLKEIDEGTAIGVETGSINYSQFGSRVTGYHIHPKFMVEQGVRLMLQKAISIPGAKKDDPHAVKEAEKMIRNVGEVLISLPSLDDVMSYSDALIRSGNCDLDFRIVNPYFITHILFDDETDPNFFYARYEPEFGQVKRKRWTDSKSEKNIAEAVKGMNKGLEDTCVINLEQRPKY